MSLTFESNLLATILSRHLADAQHREYCVAYSGGLDSTVLLHALRLLVEQGLGLGLRAIHVDHGLHPDSPRWAKECVATCKQWRIPCQVEKVDVDPESGLGIEAAAREARYGLLARLLREREVLLTAHHQDDQMETILMQLLRGAGVAGLAGMPHRAPFSRGVHLRPLLGFERASLAEYALRESLDWVHDITNDDKRFDRNFLRASVLPALTSRWPGSGGSVRRAGAHCAEAAALLDELAELDNRGLLHDEPVPVAMLLELSPARQRNVLRYRIRRQGLPLPSTRRLNAIVTDVLHAAEDSMPCVSWSGAEVRRYRGHLYLLAPWDYEFDCQSGVWKLSETFSLGRALGSLRMQEASENALSMAKTGGWLEVKFRRGGERLVLPGAKQHKELKKLFQEAGVVPWMRNFVPLVYSGENLVAVGDRWICSDFAASGREKGVRIRWDDHPPLF